MKKAITLAMTVLLLASTITPTESKKTIKVLVDESRVYTLDKELQELIMEELDFPSALASLFDWNYSFEGYLEPWGFGFAATEIKQVASMEIRKSGKLSYNVLRNYDVLILASFEKSYSPEEVEAVKKFVENGGGLFMWADAEYPNNNVSREFDVLFCSETVMIADQNAKKYTADNHQFYITDIASHPITKNVDQIALNGGIPITTYESGKVLAETSSHSWADRVDFKGFGSQDSNEDTGPFPICLAIENIGRGRAVFFGGAISFWNAVLFEADQQNLELVRNAVEWLGEPGGPLKQHQALNEEAADLLQRAKTMYSKHLFSKAEELSLSVITAYEESYQIYSNTEAEEGIKEAQNLLEKCTIGMKADEIFDSAAELYNSRKYEEAIEKYEEAKKLYKGIEYAEKVEECAAKTEESNQWITLRDEAISSLQKAEDALATAPSMFSTAGYQKARTLFVETKSKWEEYDDPEQIQACQEKISQCDEEIARIKKNRTIIILVAVLIAAGLVAYIGFTLKRRSKKEFLKPSGETEDAVFKKEDNNTQNET